MPARTDLQAEGDRQLAESLLAEPQVRAAIERLDRHKDEASARRHLLATATRLTPEMAPELHTILESCRTTLGVELPLEVYVYADAAFNAAAVRPERGRLLLMLSSSLLEAFTPAELRFVAGHEVGHWVFDHHRIPVGQLLGGGTHLDPALALQIFSWQRYAEISADRAGLISAGGLDPAASALFKLASGLRGERIQVRIDQFLAQVGDLKQEADQLASAEEAQRGDWFATHPFNPLRLKAAELFSGSAKARPDGRPDAEVEAEVQELMTLMDPSYLKDPSVSAEAMRRLLFAGGVAVASVSGAIADSVIASLERLLGPGSIPTRLKPELIRADLPSRIAAVNAHVPRLRRAQVIRDLCVIARADGNIDEAELKVIGELAAAVGVDESTVVCAIDPNSVTCASSRRPRRDDRAASASELTPV